MVADIKRELGQSLGTDFYLMDELLTEQERSVRDKVRNFSDKEVIPIINDYWERAEFPFELVPKLAALGLAGADIKGYGCPGLSPVAAGLMALELARGDASVCGCGTLRATTRPATVSCARHTAPNDPDPSRDSS